MEPEEIDQWELRRSERRKRRERGLFVRAALTGLLASTPASLLCDAEEVANKAYELADAMMARREDA